MRRDALTLFVALINRLSGANKPTSSEEDETIEKPEAIQIHQRRYDPDAIHPEIIGENLNQIVIDHIVSSPYAYSDAERICDGYIEYCLCRYNEVSAKNNPLKSNESDPSESDEYI
ncbi:MAG: hypothetical protein AAF633_11335 [Chloroflexota bacterium]